jgi:Zn-dependent protease
MRYGPKKTSLGSKLKKIFGPLALVLVLVVKFFGKLKFILLPLLKFIPALLKTGGSMILSVGGYALFYGWKFAVGLVMLIFVHECGHLLAARRVGLPVGLPVFIPFMGAIIALKQAPKNAWIEAQVGIGGPLLGSLGALVCHLIYFLTGGPLFAVLAQVGYMMNLFNLAPIGFLDGGRIVTALSPWLWVVGTVIIGVMLVTHANVILFLVLILSLPRLFSLFRKRTDEEKRFYEVTPSQRLIIAVLYFGLAAALAVGMKFTLLPKMPTQ